MTSRLLRLPLLNQKVWKRYIFFSKRKKPEEPDYHPHAYENRMPEYLGIFVRHPIKETREAYQEFKIRCHDTWKEFKDNTLPFEPELVRPNEVDVLWRFDKDPKSVDDWLIACDRDHRCGFSTVQKSLSQEGKLLFTGVLDTTVPKDGEMTRTGYCTIRTQVFRTTLLLEETYRDWSNYTHLVMRVRGDGRSYVVNLGSKGFYDLHWADMYNYFLFTRGGPYWQTVFIPFSKFMLTSCGSIQDKQVSLPSEKISSFGITVSDKINGPFKLEIDFIGVMYSTSNYEEFAYELYDLGGILQN